MPQAETRPAMDRDRYPLMNTVHYCCVLASQENLKWSNGLDAKRISYALRNRCRRPVIVLSRLMRTLT